MIITHSHFLQQPHELAGQQESVNTIYMDRATLLDTGQCSPMDDSLHFLDGEASLKHPLQGVSCKRYLFLHPNLAPSYFVRAYKFSTKLPSLKLKFLSR